MRFKKRQRGFISMIVLIVIALLVLKYVFNVSFRDILESRIVGELWSIIKQIFNLLWEACLLTVDFLKVIFEKLKDFVSNLKAN